MPSTDYTSTGGGLKLKGVKNAGIDKKRKKKKQPSSSSSSTAVVTASKDSNTNNDTDTANPSQTSEPLTTTTAKQDRQKVEDALIPPQSDGKTESERRHDEMRRKRLEERLLREGSKTHKERVEELNKYLSGLSEHHDMPRIGPG